MSKSNLENFGNVSEEVSLKEQLKAKKKELKEANRQKKQEQKTVEKLRKNNQYIQPESTLYENTATDPQKIQDEINELKNEIKAEKLVNDYTKAIYKKYKSDGISQNEMFEMTSYFFNDLVGLGKIKKEDVEKHIGASLNNNLTNSQDTEQKPLKKFVTPLAKSECQKSIQEMEIFNQKAPSHHKIKGGKEAVSIVGQTLSLVSSGLKTMGAKATKFAENVIDTKIEKTIGKIESNKEKSAKTKADIKSSLKKQAQELGSSAKEHIVSDINSPVPNVGRNQGKGQGKGQGIT